jgi:pimeloyl-ACP methyl ester carboxylesterase
MMLDVAGSPVYAYSGARALAPGERTVVFVHGAANDHSVWALQSRYFAHHGRNVLAVDLPGHGRSGGAALASVEAIADWIVALLDGARIREAALVGHSLGSLAVLECAARHSARVTGAALLGPAFPMAVSDALLDAAQRDERLAHRLITGWSFSASRQLGGNRVPGVWMTGNAMRLMERTPPGVLHTDLNACHAYAGGLDAAARLSCPVLAVLAARDAMAPPKNAQALMAALREPRVAVLPDCGHAMMTEQPDAVLDHLRTFL